jgi:hypothetical protein
MAKRTYCLYKIQNSSSYIIYLIQIRSDTGFSFEKNAVIVKELSLWYQYACILKQEQCMIRRGAGQKK